MRISIFFLTTALCLPIFVLSGQPVAAQDSIRVESDPIACLPLEENGVASATVENNVPDTTVRLYFRRMHDAVEDLYWVQMQPAGQGRDWAVMPKADISRVTSGPPFSAMMAGKVMGRVRISIPIASMNMPKTT